MLNWVRSNTIAAPFRVAFFLAIWLGSLYHCHGQYYLYLTADECSNAYLAAKMVYPLEMPISPVVLLAQGEDSVFWDAFLEKAGVPTDWEIDRHPDPAKVDWARQALSGRSGFVGVRNGFTFSCRLDGMIAYQYTALCYQMASFSPKVASSYLLPASFPMSSGMAFQVDPETGEVFAIDYALDRMVQFHLGDQTVEIKAYEAASHPIKDYLKQFPFSDGQIQAIMEQYPILEQMGKDQISIRSIGQMGKRTLFMVEITLPASNTDPTGETTLSLTPQFYSAFWNGESFEECTHIGIPDPHHLDIDQHRPLWGINSQTLLVPGFSLKGNDNSVLLEYSRKEGSPGWEYVKALKIQWPSAAWKKWRRYPIGEFLYSGECIAFKHMPLLYLPKERRWVSLPSHYKPEKLFETDANGHTKANFEVKGFHYSNGIAEMVLAINEFPYWCVLETGGKNRLLRWELLKANFEGQICFLSPGRLFQIGKGREVRVWELLGKGG